MQVKDLMCQSVVWVDPQDNAANAAALLERHNVGSLPVCGTQGDLRGIVTDRDIVVRCVAVQNDPSKTEVQQIMSRNCATVSPTADTREAARLMAQEQVRRLPVVEEGKVVGMVSLGDLSLSHSCDMEAGAALSEISEDCHNAQM